MPAISIVFGALANPHFHWYDNFETLTDEEVIEFAFLCRNATTAFFGELADRRGTSKVFIEDYDESLLRNADSINEHGITRVQAAYLKDFDQYLAEPIDGQLERQDIKQARQFLWLTSRVTHWSYALLIVCTLGKHRLQQLNDDQRVKLLKYIVTHRTALHCRRLEDEATQCNLDQINFRCNPPSKRGSRKRVHSEHTAADETASAANRLVNEARKRRFPIDPLSNETDHSLKDQVRESLVQVKRESADAATLIALLCFLDGTNIPGFMLSRAKDPQKDWGPSGEVQEEPVTEVGLDRDVLSLILDPVKIDRAINVLEAAKLITSAPGAYGCPTLRLDSEKQLCLTQIVHDPSAWRLQALILVCHTFPMHSWFEPLYGNLGRLQIHQVQYVAEYHQSLGSLPSSRLKHKVAEVLLAASHFQDMRWKSKALQVVETLMVGEPADYLQTWVQLRKHSLAGLEIGNEVRGSVVLNVPRIDARSNAFYGNLMLSNVTNNIRRKNLTCARATLDQIVPFNFDRPSTMEQLVLGRKSIAMGRIERYQGNFGKAYQHLAALVGGGSLDAATGRSLICQLAGVLCELGKESRAQTLLQGEINVLGRLGFQDIPSGRRLRLSLAETLLLQGRLREAEDIYLGLKMVEDCPNPTIITCIEKLRLLMGLARVSHLGCWWPKALENWENALRVSQECGWKAGFNEMVVRYSIGHVYLALGQQEMSDRNIERADELYAREGRQYWLTGVGTRWLDRIWQLLGHDPRVSNLGEA